MIESIKEGTHCEVLFDEEYIQNKVKQIAQEISTDYKDKNLLVISVLKGSVFFTADLLKYLDIKNKLVFIQTSSYGDGKKHCGKVNVIMDYDKDITDYDVLLVDDILDTGLTMKYLVEHFASRNPKSVKVCTLFDKPSRRIADIQADYVGIPVEDLFLVGYGLDYEDYYRNIPYVFTVIEDK